MPKNLSFHSFLHYLIFLPSRPSLLLPDRPVSTSLSPRNNATKYLRTLDKDTPTNNRPISYFNTISKIIERLILVRIRQHLTSSPSFNSAQSAYRRHHSTETALLRTMDAVCRAADRGEVTLIVALDISAAFDTIDHTIHLILLHYSFGVDGNLLSLTSSYLVMRSQPVRVGSASSAPSGCSCGVPQGSVLSPILFTV